ncbi:TetR family transcriptional regulator [Streptomyces sp. HUAS 31]|uniref:TetR family transcriptional regulator n=1 Tax=Streptomyces chartreusis TaxID=1969 RepID=A0A7H8T6B3_STRCX|nr:MULTISPECIES: TetR/AcrR family transcriptional regulator [Streptomyces]MBT1095654.1 TetR family transcriptional regulator [Streptomyces sp. Tu102]QEV67755.1 TetR/AcrR family transcriptional regulator [Streptomyces chartreusis]QKZ18874.1 TetR family transcriptional regulator [Streptomyces chartreusis]RSO02802.1 TetR family transcriptional regulator [Streptomyces sp. WAC 05379]WCD99396.1 TetR family transcriptional regulator [Streptomyces sp. HUAS 31]
MAGNPERRAALVDAGVEVLARQGARGLTFRAVDAEAGVPVGTASNYFTGRDDLLRQIDTRLHVRLAPDPDVIAGLLARPKDRSLVTAFMHDLMARATRDRTGYLAMLEMRLEASRHPELRSSFTKSVRGDLDEAIEFHRGAGLPGGDEVVTVLYLAMLGLLLEHLTLPDVLEGVLPGVGVPDGLVERIAETIVPEK